MKTLRHHAFTAFVGTVLGTITSGIILTYKQPTWNMNFDLYGHQFKTKLVGIQCLPFYPVEWLIFSSAAAFGFHHFEQVIEEAERADD